MNAQHPMRYVSVIGGHVVSPETMAEAETLGRLLAGEGIVVVTGGREGVAEAVSRGASEAGGIVVGILPEADRSRANPHLTVAVCTGIGETRNSLVAMNGEVVVAFAGSWGTLSEIAHARLAGRPVIAVGAWRTPLEGLGIAAASVLFVADAAEAARRAIELLG